MLEVTYTPNFIRQYNSLEVGLQEEIAKKIKLLKNQSDHKALRVHKLHGKLHGCHSFSISYRIHIIFEYKGTKEILCHAVGDHDLYK